jgi:hypothetical protein
VLLTISVNCVPATCGTPDDKQKLESAFGRLQPAENLFAIGSSFLLKVSFKETRISTAWIIPKYFLIDRHPEWVEPDQPPCLASGTMKPALSKLQKIRSLGELRLRATVAEVTNNRGRFVDYYRNGVVERGELIIQRGGPCITFLRISFFEQVSGMLESKDEQSLGPDRRFRVRIDGQWYWTSRESYVKAIPGRVMTIGAAGPISLQY